MHPDSTPSVSALGIFYENNPLGFDPCCRVKNQLINIPRSALTITIVIPSKSIATTIRIKAFNPEELDGRCTLTQPPAFRRWGFFMKTIPWDLILAVELKIS
jgi:hypothetical protein